MRAFIRIGLSVVALINIAVNFATMITQGGISDEHCPVYKPLILIGYGMMTIATTMSWHVIVQTANTRIVPQPLPQTHDMDEHVLAKLKHSTDARKDKRDNKNTQQDSKHQRMTISRTEILELGTLTNENVSALETMHHNQPQLNIMVPNTDDAHNSPLVTRSYSQNYSPNSNDSKDAYAPTVQSPRPHKK